MQVESLHLLKVGRVLNDAVADNARKADADRLDGLAATHQLDLGSNGSSDVFGRHHLYLRLTTFRRVDPKGAHNLRALHQPDRQVFCCEYPDLPLHDTPHPGRGKLFPS